MTVTIEGHIGPEDADAARAFIETGEDWGRFHCLCYYGPSLSGLGQWIPQGGGRIHAVGNLSERGYDTADIASTLVDLMAVAPSLELKVHCGGDYESTECVATVTAFGGVASVGVPEIAEVGVGLIAQGEERLREMMGDHW